MENKQKLNAEILKITMKINNHYPELSKYLEEMPVTIPDAREHEITCKNLLAYYESLKAMISGYVAQKTQARLEKAKNFPL